LGQNHIALTIVGISSCETTHNISTKPSSTLPLGAPRSSWFQIQQDEPPLSFFSSIVMPIITSTTLPSLRKRDVYNQSKLPNIKKKETFQFVGFDFLITFFIMKMGFHPYMDRMFSFVVSFSS
jgi:hypothetical protein